MSHNTSVLKCIALSVVSLLVTTSCTLRPPKTAEGGGTTTTPTTEPKSAIATPVDFQSPGPYKTVTVDGAELRQGRYPQGVYGGSLIQASIGSDPKTYNPWVASDTLSSQLGGMMFSGLVMMDPYSGDMVPDLAADYTVEPDHLTYTFRLRKGLKWSDGKPLNADDVLFTFNNIVAKGFGNTSLRDGMTVEGKMPEVTKVDDLTVKFKTPKPFAPFLRQVGIPIAPKHVLEPIVNGGDGRKKFGELWSQTDTDTPKTLVTSGPFVLSKVVPSQRVEFTRTKNYYVVDPAGKPLPYLDKLVYLVVPDVNTNLFKFEGGETDIAGIRMKDAAGLQKKQDPMNMKLYNLGASTGTTFVMFNMNRRKNDKGDPYVKPYKSVWFNDVNFRQAINHALNRQQMIDGYLVGIGTPAWSAEPIVSPFLDPDLKPIEPDANYSKQLLAKSAFAVGKDGMLHDKDGHLVEIDLLAPAGATFYDAIAGYIQTDLKKLGIKINYQPVDWNVLMDKVDSSKNWEMAIYGLAGDPLDPNSGANVWKSDGRLHLFDEREAGADGKIVVKDARPWEKELDAIFDQGVEELDTAKRKQIYDRYQQIIYDQAPFVYLVNPMTIVGARNTIKNYQPTKLSQNILGLHNLDEIWKEQSK